MKIHQKKPMTGRNLAILGSNDLRRIRGGAFVGGGGGGNPPPPPQPPPPPGRVPTPTT